MTSFACPLNKILKQNRFLRTAILQALSLGIVRKNVVVTPNDNMTSVARGEEEELLERRRGDFGLLAIYNI